MIRRTATAVITVLLLAGVEWAGAGSAVIMVGAVYPTRGSQGPGGASEYHGVQLAADYMNARGGVAGRQIRLRLDPADSADAAPDAVQRLAARGAAVVVGSYGSTISRPAAATANRLGLVFWETGAVGLLRMDEGTGTRVFRVAPTGATLGRAAVQFVHDKLAARLRVGHPPRYAVAYVDDVYGRSVGFGALDRIRALRLPLAAALPYELRTVRYADFARRIAASHADVLVVSAYLEDGVAMRRAIVAAHVPLAASIGTSSSYCLPVFGAMLGKEAVGLFASDKPDGDILKTNGLTRDAAQALVWARTTYRHRYGAPMDAPALAGFAGGMALFAHVFPRARGLTAAAVAASARTIDLPSGSLPNGSGLRFGRPGTPAAGSNLRAAHVIWEWVRPNTRAIVWPPEFATGPMVIK